MCPGPSAQTSFDFSPRAHSGTELTRPVDPLRARLQALEGEHEKLLASIGRKRAKVLLNLEQHETASQALGGTLLGLRERAAKSITRMRTLLEALVGTGSRLSKRNRKRVESVLREIIEEFPLDELEPGEKDDAPPDGSEWGFAWDDDRAPAGDVKSEAGFSAPKPGAQQGSLKALFKRLAVAAHPDRVQDEQQKLERTQVMAEVTQAYERGDLARLLELERSWLAAEALEPHDDEALLRHIEQLEATNKELRRQLRTLQQEDRELRDGPGRVDAKGKVRFSIAVQCMLDQLEAAVANLELAHQYTERFARGEMSVEEFLEGPELPDEDVAIEDIFFEEIFGDFVVEPVRPRQKPVRRKKKGKKGKKKR